MRWLQLRINIVFLLSILVLSGKASAQSCISPFKQLSSGHHSISDFDLFQTYNSELEGLKIVFKRKDRVSAEQQTKNISSLREFYRKTTPKPQLTTLNRALHPAQATEILNSIAPHPVIGDKVAFKYDPTHEIGFCFGRAAYVHIELLRRGISAQHIAKVFVMGGLYLDGIGWDFHVATIAQDESGTWWAIDSLFAAPLPLEDWMHEVSRWDANQKFPGLRFFFADALKFQALKGSYDSTHFYSEVYRKYFEDLTNWYTRDPNCLSAKTPADPHLFICQK